ncbi:MAG: hypothetical protein EBT15_11660, partial [Betaproteobacteria bacterium]|nr:hypothetical protein [Betaproteobacteria bacterium]
AYAPWGNAQLAFELGTGFASTDPATGNAVQTTETVEYLAAITLQPPNWKPEAGADNTTYSCRGRLLSPATLDPRITNGSQAEAVINGYRGRFELVFNLAMPAAQRRDLRQPIEGTFRVIGGPS